MPSQRKRIGFLPRSEVQDLIDKISRYNKLSQSKVTGILVEEALSSRGILNSSIDKISLNFQDIKINSSLINDYATISKNSNEDYIDSKESYIKDEIEMINDYIEFKFFKKMMTNRK